MPDAVTADLTRYLSEIDAKDAVYNACDRILTDYYEQFSDSLIDKGKPIRVSGVKEMVTLHWLVRFMSVEEYNTDQAIYWLACKQAVAECDFEFGLTGWQIINHCKKEGLF